jgi:fructuronate reductase
MRLTRRGLPGLGPPPPRPRSTGVLHLGLGAFHRAHQADYFDRLLHKGHLDWGVASVNLRSRDIVTALRQQDMLFTRWTRGAARESLTINGAMTGCHHLPGDRDAVMAQFRNPGVRLITVTVSEKGYCCAPGSGLLDTDSAEVCADLAAPAAPCTMPGLLAAGLDARRRAEAGPVTVVSCDNLRGNGRVLRTVVRDFAERRFPDLVPWLATDVRFPSSMVDGIVPRIRDADRQALIGKIGLDDPAMVIAEDYMRWVIEDDFAGGRPPLDEVGVEFVSDAAPYEAMKLLLLNAPHSALAYLGHNAGFAYVHDAMRDARLAGFLHQLIAQELLPVALGRGDTGARDYAALTLSRFANPNIAYGTRQVAADGSLKLRERILPAISHHLAEGRVPERLALVLAAWIRFLTGRTESGAPYEIPDPIAHELRRSVEAARGETKALLDEVLSTGGIFPEDIAVHAGFHARVVYHLDGCIRRGTLAWIEETGLAGRGS